MLSNIADTGHKHYDRLYRRQNRESSTSEMLFKK